MFSAFSDDLTATEKAAAGLVVLTNNVKDLNKEVRETQKTTQQLSSTLERFERLNRQRFRSATEMAEMNELQADLQRRLETTSVGFDLVFEARSQIRENQDEIQRLTNEVRDLIQVEFARNPAVSFSDLLNSDVLSDEIKENIPLLVET
jgi:predicted RNase H-like nuclease (RuvC/YqgF family)